jgi:hypothetical protein
VGSQSRVGNGQLSDGGQSGQATIGIYSN